MLPTRAQLLYKSIYYYYYYCRVAACRTLSWKNVEYRLDYDLLLIYNIFITGCRY